MITLIGHGYVGNYIGQELAHQKIKFNWISHLDDIPLNTDFIINAAGFTGIPNVDACEMHKDETIEGNVLFPIELEQRFAIPILHISSGCVYTGYVDGGWIEDDVPNFTFDNASFYSASKALFQDLLSPYLNRSYLFRIRMPFGPDNSPKNLLVKLKNYDKLIDKLNSLSQVEDVAKAAVYFALNRPPPGIYNAVNPNGVYTHEIAQLMKLNKLWMSDAEFNDITVAPRSNCVLNSDKMQKVFKFRTAQEALIETISSNIFK